MSDETPDVLAAPVVEGTPEPQVPQFKGEPGAVEDDSKPVTKAELKAFLADFSEEVKRSIQSMTAKQENRLRKDIDTKLQRMEDFAKQAGLTDEEKKAMRGKVINDALEGYIKEDAPSAQKGADQPIDLETKAAVEQQAASMLARIGIDIKDTDWDDPVWKEVNTSPDATAKQFLDSYRAAALKYIEKQEGQPARSPGLLGGAPTGSKYEQLNQRLQEIQDLPLIQRTRAHDKEVADILKEMEALER